MYEELKPCPNCESIRAAIAPPNFNGFSYAWCVSCGVRGPMVKVNIREDHHVGYDDVEDAWNSLPRAKPLAWTKERPTEPGVFWVRFAALEHRSIREPWTIRVDQEYIAMADGIPSNCEFAGPIPEPVEAK